MAPFVPMRVVVFGATGAVGSEVVRQCLAAPWVSDVAAVVRRPPGFDDPRLTAIVHDDFDDFASIARELTGRDACLYCLGISAQRMHDPVRYRAITHGYAVAAARSLKASSPEHVFHFLSAEGADPTGRSRMYWARVKGETERDLGAMQLAGLVIWRPGYVHPMRGRAKPLVTDRLLGPVYPVLRPLLSGWTTDTVELARAMLHATRQGLRRGVLRNRVIRRLAAAAVEPSHPGR